MVNNSTQVGIDGGYLQDQINSLKLALNQTVEKFQEIVFYE